MRPVLAFIIDRPVDGTYVDGTGQTQTVRGRLRALDDSGFTVIEGVDGKHIVIPKDKFIRFDELNEEEYQAEVDQRSRGY